jgi:hypothetical protein
MAKSAIKWLRRATVLLLILRKLWHRGFSFDLIQAEGDQKTADEKIGDELALVVAARLMEDVRCQAAIFAPDPIPVPLLKLFGFHVCDINGQRIARAMSRLSTANTKP